MPTILRMAGATVPSDLDGVDASALLLHRKTLTERVLFWGYNGQSAARLGEWKLLTSYSEGLGSPLEKGPWLSNLVTDPGETRNVAAEKPEVVARLSDAIATWRAKYP